MSNNVTLPPQGTSGTTNAIVESLDTTGASGPQRQFVSLRSSVAGDTADVLGTTGDTAPSTDTAAASINGRLQRVAQNLTTINTNQPTAAAQGSTTSGQTGTLALGAVSTASPSYTATKTSPLSLDASGNLRVNVVAGGSSSSNKPVGPASIAASQATIGTSSAQIVAARTGSVGTGRCSVTLKNTGTATVFIGQTGVTLTTGFPLGAGEIDSFDTTAALFGISTVAGNVICVMETF